ncbi:hypothetical protein JCM8097_005861 [Rhodosporidiobolus ruineniae]
MASPADDSQLGLTAPMAREVETVTTRTQTRTSHAPRRASQLPLTLDDSTFARDLPADEYALLHLAPAVTTTVVTTTTQTRTTFAPIRIPRSRTIRPAFNSFSGPSGADAPRASDAAPLTPKTSFLRFLEKEEGDGRASSSALKLDPRLYPLSQASWPEGMQRFNVELGGMRATFQEDSAEEAPGGFVSAPVGGALNTVSMARQDSKGKGKAREVDDADSAEGAGGLSRSDRGALHQRRLARRPKTAGIVSPGAEDMDEDLDASAARDPSAAPSARTSPGPPRKRPRADSASFDHFPSYLDSAPLSPSTRLDSDARRPSQAGLAGFIPSTPANPHAATTLPSPNQSPPSPVPTFGGEESQELKDADDSPYEHAGQLNPQAFDFGSGAALSGLLSLPDLINTFDQLPPNLQSYLIFQLLRRSSIPVLQTLNGIIEPSLRRDFLVDLPPELGVQVLCYLDAKTLCRASLVSKKWRRLIDGEWRVWKQQLVQEGLWVGDGSEEREAREIATGSSENLFLKRWKAGVWDQKRPCAWNGKVESENLYVSGVGGEARRPSVSHRLASPSSSREASPFPPSYSTHPFKLLYRRRFLIRRNWKYNTPKRTTFPAPPPQLPPRTGLPGINYVVTCLQFDKDKVISASDDHSINVFDTATGALRMSLPGHDGGIWALQYVGNVLVSGSTDRTVRVWDLSTGRCTHVFIGHTSTVRCLQIVEPQNINPDPNGPPIWQPPYPLIVTGSRDWSLRVWKLPMPGRDAEFHPVVPESPTEENTAPTQNPYHLRHLAGHSHAVRALAAHGKTLVSGSYDMDVRVWDLPSGKLRHRLSGHSQKVYSVVYDPIRQQVASGSMDCTVRLWSTETGECKAVLEGHTSLVGLLGLSHRQLVSAAADWTLRVWDPETGRCKHALAAHQGAITCFQHDEHKVISGSDGTLKMWDVATGDFVRDLLTNLTGVWQVAFDQRFCVAAVSRNNNCEFEILDFGAVDPEPPVHERAPSPFVKREEESDDEFAFAGASSTIGASGSGGAGAGGRGASPPDVTMSDLPSQETPLAGASTLSLIPPAAPRLGAGTGFTTLPSAASSTASLATTPSAGGASDSTTGNAVAGPSNRGLRRTSEGRNLRETAAAQGMEVDTVVKAEEEGEELEEDELEEEEEVARQVKAEDVE